MSRRDVGVRTGRGERLLVEGRERKGEQKKIIDEGTVKKYEKNRDKRLEEKMGRKGGNRGENARGG